MYDELFDVLFEEYLNDTDILNEDAGGARGKYIQVQKEKLKKLEEKKKMLQTRLDHAPDNLKQKYKDQIEQVDHEIAVIVNRKIGIFGDASDQGIHTIDDKSYNRQSKEYFTRLYHGDIGRRTDVHTNINNRAESQK